MVPDRDGSAKEKQVTFWKDGESGGGFRRMGGMFCLSRQIVRRGCRRSFSRWNDRAGTLGTPARLTNVSTEADGAIWSPDSQRILFTSRVYPECSEGSSWLEEDNCDRKRDEAAAKESGEGAGVGSSAVPALGPLCRGEAESSAGGVGTDGNAVRDLTPAQDIGDAEAPTFSLGGPMGYAWAPDSHEIAFVTNVDIVPAASTNNDIYYAAVG